MKNLLVLLSITAFILFLTVDGLHAQRSARSSSSAVDKFDNAIKIGPFGFLFGSYNATYERRITDKSSFVIGTRITTFSLSEVDYTGLSLSAQYRVYFQQAIAGPYFAPSIGAGRNSGAVTNFSNISAGANVGWQWLADGGFLVDLGLGARYRNGFGDSVDTDFTGVSPSFQVQVGYAF